MQTTQNRVRCTILGGKGHAMFLSHAFTYHFGSSFMFFPHSLRLINIIQPFDSLVRSLMFFEYRIRSYGSQNMSSRSRTFIEHHIHSIRFHPLLRCRCWVPAPSVSCPPPPIWEAVASGQSVKAIIKGSKLRPPWCCEDLSPE